jgi:threonyl-tRNA synthetase
MENDSAKQVENIKAHILYSIKVFANRAHYEIMWKNMVQPEKPQMTYITRRRRCACWINKATAHS